MREAPNSSEYGKNEFDTRQWTDNVGCVNHTHIHKRGIDHVYLLYHNHPMRLWFWCVFFVISFSLIFAFLNVCVEFCFARIFLCFVLHSSHLGSFVSIQSCYRIRMAHGFISSTFLAWFDSVPFIVWTCAIDFLIDLWSTTAVFA